MNLFLTADAVRVDSDEKGFALIIDTDEGDKLYVNIQPCALDFYDSVRNVMRGWVAEAEMARAGVGATGPMYDRPQDNPFLGGYALDDPKSPGYHDRMVGDN